jgi:hypothetical protein
MDSVFVEYEQISIQKWDVPKRDIDVAVGP